MISNLKNVFTMIGLAILRCGVPIVGIWMLGVGLKHTVGTHKDNR
jgi:hypothetical protein